MKLHEIATSTLSPSVIAKKLKCSTSTVYRIKNAIFAANDAMSKNELVPTHIQQTLNNFNMRDGSYSGIGRPPKSHTTKRTQLILSLILKSNVMTRGDLSRFIVHNKALIDAINYNNITPKRKSNFTCDPSTAIKYLKGKPFNLKDELNTTEFLSVFNVTLPTEPAEYILVVANAALWEESKKRNKFFSFYPKIDTSSEKELLLDFYIKLLRSTHCEYKAPEPKEEDAKTKKAPTEEKESNPEELIFREKDAATFKELLARIEIPEKLSPRDFYTYLIYFSYDPKERIPAIKAEIEKLVRNPSYLEKGLAKMEEAKELIQEKIAEAKKRKAEAKAKKAAEAKKEAEQTNTSTKESKPTPPPKKETKTPAEPKKIAKKLPKIRNTRKKRVDGRNLQHNKTDI